MNAVVMIMNAYVVVMGMYGDLFMNNLLRVVAKDWHGMV